MSAHENLSVEEENLQQDPHPPEADNEHTGVSSEDQETHQNKRNDAEYNWAEVRRQLREQNQKIEELNKLNSQLSSNTSSPEEEFGFNDDDLIEGKHLKELKKEFKKWKSEVEQREAKHLDERIQLKYPDFNEVVNEENINLLNQKRPRLAKALAGMSDPYEKALEAYELMKDLGIKNGPPSLEKRKAEENSQKPLSVQAVSKTSSLGEANVFAQMDAQGKKNFYKQKYAEMMESIKGA